MKFLILSENSNGTWPYLHYRNLGSFELKKRIVSYGYEASILEWFTHWSHKDLKTFIENYFQGIENPVIALSTPFTTVDVHKIKSVLQWAKNSISNLKIIHGGARNYDSELGQLIDVFFLGRSMEIFDRWLKNDNLSKYIINTNPTVLVNYNFNEKIDTPVIALGSNDDFLNSTDIIGFELGVGCKFNCSFCNYELRNAKITTLADPIELRNYLQEAYNRYQITNFFASDDTINETDEKLEVIAEAISDLNFSPKITAFARLDLISARPRQIDLLQKINFHSLFFGIESFNPEASRAIRKKSGLDNTYPTLVKIRDTCANTYTVGGLIIGLNNDSKKDIYTAVDKVINEKLLKSLQFYPLSITRPEGHTGLDFFSDLDKDPEAFGYKTKGFSNFHHDNKTIISLNWESNWTDYENAALLTDELLDYSKGKIDLLNHLEYAGMCALNTYQPNTDLNVLQHRSYVKSQIRKLQYTKNKLSIME